MDNQHHPQPVAQSFAPDLNSGVSMDSAFASSAASALLHPAPVHEESDNGQANQSQISPFATDATTVIPPLTPIKDARKRTFSSEDRDEEEPLSSTEPRLSPPITTSTTQGVTKDTKPLIHWHFISSAAGEANAAYSSFVPLRLRSSSSASESDDLPDINETELWWGMAGARGGETKTMEKSNNDLIEQKHSDSDEVSQQDSKRIKLSEGCPMSPSPPSASNAAAATAASPLSSSPVPNNLSASLLGSFGQDAYFSSSQFGCSIMAVADGVGGWRENGIDSGEVSRAMMAATRAIALSKFDADKSKKNFMLNPSELLISAYNKVKTGNEVEGGSTTVCIVALTPVPVTQLCTTVIPVHAAHQQQLDQQKCENQVSSDSSAAMEVVSAAAIANYIAADASMLDVIGAVIDQSQNMVAHNNAAVPLPPQIESIVPQPLEPLTDVAAASSEVDSNESGENVYLSACNLGDSGYMILRRDEEGVYRLVTLSNFQRNIRAVKQVAIIPPQFQHDSYCDDSPAEAELDAHKLQENDIVILATDGLWDNLIATDWSETLFLPYFNSAATTERIAKQRKVSMCQAVEVIAAECAKLFQAKKDSFRSQHLPSDSVAPSTHSTPSRPFRPSISFSPSTQHSSLFSSSSSALDHHTLVSITRDDMPDSGPNSRNPSPYEDSTEANDTNMTEQTNTNVAVAVNSAAQAAALPIVGSTSVQGSPISFASSSLDANSELNFNWDQFEVDLIADQLKQSALKFMVQPGGKPDDLTICVSKLKREVRVR